MFMQLLCKLKEDMPKHLSKEQKREIKNKSISEQEDLTKNQDLPGVDSDLGLYELCEIFDYAYKYHNSDCLVSYDGITSLDTATGKLNTKTKTLSRFEAIRRVEAARLGSRPYLANQIAKHRPNVSLGYLATLMKFLVLPYKSLFTDSDWARVRVNKRLHDELTLDDQEKEELRIQAANNPVVENNKEVGDDVSDAYSEVLKTTKHTRKIEEQIPRRVIQDGLGAVVYSDLDWRPEVVHAIDLVTEPQAGWDSEDWSFFFVIKKLHAQEAVKHIREDTSFWNTAALKWALEASMDGRGYLNGNHYGSYHNNFHEDVEKACGQNYMVKSYYSEKSLRREHLGLYYGNMLVVEAYYTNKKGKVNKAIFFPSEDFIGISSGERKRRHNVFAGKESAKDREKLQELQFADILFHREDVFDSIDQAITVIPFDRSESSLERQRPYTFDMFSPIEMIMRLDCSILHFSILMGVPFTKNRNQGTDGQNIEDVEINFNGDTIDLGDRDFIETPFTADLNGMLAVRRILLQHVAGQAFLGGLDGEETKGLGGAEKLANMRLIRDGRVHKHSVEEFARGLTEVWSRIFMLILDLNQRNHFKRRRHYSEVVL